MSLSRLAEGRGEPLVETIRAICAAFDKTPWEGTVGDALTFWITNYGPPLSALDLAVA